MNRKLLITTMPWAGRDIRVCALAEDMKVLELRLCPSDRQELLDSIHLGQVQKVLPFMNGAFVTLAHQENCFLNLAEGDSLYRPGTHNNHPLQAMDQVVVQVSKEASRKKGPSVTGHFTLKSADLVLTHGSGQNGVSKRIPAVKRDALKEWLLKAPIPENCGLILRTSAAECETEALDEQLSRLCEGYRQLISKANTRPVFTLLKKAMSPEITWLEELKADQLVVKSDSPEVLSEIREHFGDRFSMELYDDRLLPLYKLYSLETVLERSLSERVWLKSGGFIVIQQTDAFVSVDVNSGKYQGKKHTPQETYMRINKEAAREIACQLRLRNLSGMILIDFINLRSREDRQEILSYMKDLAACDPVPCEVIDITGLHIMELTRKKIRKPLSEQLS